MKSSSKLFSSLGSSLVASILNSKQTNSTVSSSKTLLIVTILPNMNNILIISEEFLLHNFASSATLIPSVYVIALTCCSFLL